LLSGCWDREELNDVAIILISSIDLEEDGKYRITHLIPLPRQLAGSTKGGSSSGKPYYLDSETGSTLHEANHKMQRRMARRMSFSHRRTIVLGETFAKKDISMIFENMPRSYENRLSNQLVVCEGKGANLLKATPVLERFPSEAIRELLKQNDIYSVDMKQAGTILSFQGDPIVPYVQIKKTSQSDNTSEELTVSGYAMFRNTKMLDVFVEDASYGILWLLDENLRYMLTFPASQEQSMSILILDGQTQIIPNRTHGKLSFDIFVKAKARLQEDLSNKNTFEPTNIQQIERQLAEKIKDQMTDAIQLMKNHQTDSAQFELVMWRRFPDIWNTIERNKWNQQFANIKITIRVDARLIDTGLSNRNIIAEDL
jgi:spore germination protein KC